MQPPLKQKWPRLPHREKPRSKLKNRQNRQKTETEVSVFSLTRKLLGCPNGNGLFYANTPVNALWLILKSKSTMIFSSTE